MNSTQTFHRGPPRVESPDDEIAAAAKCFPEATHLELRDKDILIWIPTGQDLAGAWDKAMHLQTEFNHELLPMAKACL